MIDSTARVRACITPTGWSVVTARTAGPEFVRPVRSVLERRDERYRTERPLGSGKDLRQRVQPVLVSLPEILRVRPLGTRSSFRSLR